MDERRDYPMGVVPPTAYQRPYQQSTYQQLYSQQHQQMQQAQRPNPLANFAEGAQKMTPGGFQPLNREERREAERIALEASFNYNGYQVVRREFFSHKFDPSLTFKGNSITFNNACISSLDGVVYVQVLVNPDEKKLVIRPCAEGARDAIRWCIAKTEKRKSRQITCLPFTTKIYNIMNWENLYYYKLQGTRINYEGQEIYIFDLTSEEPFPPSVKTSDAPGTRAKPRKAVFANSDPSSFGLTVEAHDASTQIDLMQGYGLEGLDKGTEAQQMPMEMIDQETGEVTKV